MTDESARPRQAVPLTLDDDTEVSVNWQRLPAVGIRATATNADEVARTILRAKRHGHDVLVLPAAAADAESVEFARELDAHVVDVSERLSSNGAESHLEGVARTLGYPGLIYNGDADADIDYDETLASLDGNGDYGVEAVVRAADPDHPAADVIVGIPAYNEAGTIADVIASVSEYAGTVLVVDDGSTDDTAAVAAAAGAVVVEHSTNLGYGAGLRTIFSEAARRNVDHLVVIDGDGQHDAADVPRLVEAQRSSGAEVVIGSRFGEGGQTDAPLYRRFGLFVINALTNVSIGTIGSQRITDTQSGFRAYDRRAIESLAADQTIGAGMGASTDILYHAHRRQFSIHEIGTSISYAVENGSTQNPISHGLHLLNNILKTMKRDQPGTLLGVPGFVTALFGVSLLVWTVSSIGSGVRLPFAATALGAVFTLVGSLSCLYGFVAHSINVKLDEQLDEFRSRPPR